MYRKYLRQFYYKKVMVKGYKGKLGSYILLELVKWWYQQTMTSSCIKIKYQEKLLKRLFKEIHLKILKINQNGI